MVPRHARQQQTQHSPSPPAFQTKFSNIILFLISTVGRQACVFGRYQF